MARFCEEYVLGIEQLERAELFWLAVSDAAEWRRFSLVIGRGDSRGFSKSLNGWFVVGFMCGWAMAVLVARMWLVVRLDGSSILK